jgi:hypothetical protein
MLAAIPRTTAAASSLHGMSLAISLNAKMIQGRLLRHSRRPILSLQPSNPIIPTSRFSRNPGRVACTGLLASMNSRENR